jgi:hypothetical protein
MKNNNMNKLFRIYFFLTVIFLPACTLNVSAEPEIFIRFNQIGYLNEEPKTAVVLSNHSLIGKTINILDFKTKKSVLKVPFNSDRGTYGAFQYSYIVDFSELRDNGDYQFEFSTQRTTAFKIGNNVYSGVADSLLTFFLVQRCGYTNPHLHKTCHISDATRLIDQNKNIFQQYDATGGWHDAGDYVKFLNTTAFSTYMLLFAYEFDPQKFSFDNNNNNVPDLLEEAKIGLDWLLRANYKDSKLITQVQDLRDHDVGWRMPEDDPLAFDRPAYLGIGKNLIGIYAAALSMGGRIWKDKMQLPDFADKCISVAERFYSLRNRVQDIDSSGSGMYIDNSFEGKMALGAAELYLATNKKFYLDEAMVYADSANSDHWWSWGNINSLAHYKLAQFNSKYADYIKNNLDGFDKNSEKNLFGKGTVPSWGTNVTLLGITLQNILYQKLKGFSPYERVASIQKDFVLGRNPWGISFISGVGKNFSRNLHHQVFHLKKTIRGGFAAGPASKDLIEKSKIPFEKFDTSARFQTKEAYYRDDRMDYISNEPTITGNATAIFVFGNLMLK